MKKVYSKPTIEGELFAVNEYVAACYEVSYGQGWNKVTWTVQNPTADQWDSDGLWKEYGPGQGPNGKWYTTVNGYKVRVDLRELHGPKANASN